MEEGVRVYERNSLAHTPRSVKKGKEVFQAEIPLQTTVGQLSPSSPRNTMMEQSPTCRIPCYSRWMPKESCDPGAGSWQDL